MLKGPPNIPLIVFRVNLSAVAQAGEGIPEFPDTEQPVIHKGDYFIIASDIPGIQGILNNVTGDIDLPVLWQTGEERGDEFKKILNLNTNSCIVIRIWFNKSVKPDRIPVGFTSGFKFITVYFLLSRLNDDIRECSRKTAAQCIEFIISGTPEFKNASDEEIIELITPEIIELFPELKGAATIYHHIIRHDNYTSFNKGALSLRPSVQSVFTNLFYSGDWVYLDIPVFFMERAVMTAKIAVNYILSREGITPNRIYLPEVKGILSSV